MLEFKDWLILGIGAMLSVPVSMLASLLVNPLLSVTWSYQFAKWLSYPLGWTAPSQLRNCQWRDASFDGEAARSEASLGSHATIPFST
jgi:hypothetical protein